MADTITVFSTLATAIKSIAEIGKFFKGKDLNQEDQAQLAKLQSTANDLWESLTDIRQKYDELVGENRRLTAEIEKAQDWAKQESLYVLKSLGKNNVVYVKGGRVFSSEPDHFLCPQCFQKRNKSFLSFQVMTGYGPEYKCSNCGYVVHDFANAPKESREGCSVNADWDPFE